MKINPNTIRQVYSSQTKQTTNTKELSPVKNLDKIEVSAQAKQELSIQKIKSELLTSFDSDHSRARINELKAMIQSGQYQVKHREVAEAIIAYSEAINGHQDE